MENVLPWFLLKSVPGIGRYLFKRFLDHFDSPQSVMAAPVEALCRVDGVTPRLARRIKNHRLPETVKKDLELVQHRQIQIVTMSDSAYPALLRHIDDPPPFLYVLGTLNPEANCISVVGSRNATTYGRSTARRLSADLTTQGFTVVSGMALGIDTAAHEGALQAGGKTIAVLGSGFEYIYPAANRKLSKLIAENGAVITEFPMQTEPEAYNFPIRNRIISGMSLGTVVVEASRKSGSLITARLAAEQNREVFAVPGSIQSFKSIGTHTLIKQGAKLVENIQDIIEEISYKPAVAAISGGSEQPSKKRPKQMPLLTDQETLICNALETYPIHIDELIRKTDLSSGTISSTLLQLELKGVVRQTAGKMFSLVDD
jgi:DNA processing protein